MNATATKTRTQPDGRMARALELLQTAHTWQHGTRKGDGRRFHLVPGSHGHVYYADAQDCTCPSGR